MDKHAIQLQICPTSLPYKNNWQHITPNLSASFINSYCGTISQYLRYSLHNFVGIVAHVDDGISTFFHWHAATLTGRLLPWPFRIAPHKLIACRQIKIVRRHQYCPARSCFLPLCPLLCQGV